MKVLVVGAGAMGSLFAGKLTEEGVDVTLFNRKNEHTLQIAKQGLLFIDENNRKRIPIRMVSDPCELASFYDVVFVLVKAFATESVVHTIRHISHPNTVVLSLQNGLGNYEMIQKSFPNCINRIGSTECGAGITKPGTLEQRAFGKTYIGSSVQRKDPILTKLANKLTENGMETHLLDNIQSVIWSKLIVNVAYNGLTALTRLKNGDVVHSKEGKELMTKLVEEAVRIAVAEGVSLQYDDPVEKCIHIGYEYIGNNKSSMLTDIICKRKTEIDYINGAVVKLGEKHGILTPYNETVTSLIKIIENNYKQAVSVI